MADGKVIEVVGTLAGKASATSGVGTLFLGLNIDEWGILSVIVGITVTILTFFLYAFHTFWKIKHAERRLPGDSTGYGYRRDSD